MELDVVFKSVFFLCCLLHTYTDFREYLLYDEVSLAMLMTGVIRAFNLSTLDSAALGAFSTGFCFFILYVLARGGMGFGDVKLAAVLGLWLGWAQGLLALLVALWLGSAVAVVLLLLSKGDRRTAIPFGPYMCVGGFLMLMYGESVMTWYLNLFF